MRIGIGILVALLGAWACASASAAPAAPAVEAIRIGMVVEATGPNAALGAAQINGARLAMDEVNGAGGVLGRPLMLEQADNQSTNPGSVVALQKLLERGDITALVSSIRSTQILAMMPGILKAGIPTMIGGSDYTLTHTGNPWVFRVRPHDGYSAQVFADFGIHTLKRRRWAIVHTAETFGIGGRMLLAESLKAAGVTPVLVQPINLNAQDFSPALQALKHSDADIVATYITGAPNVAAFATQMRQAGIGIDWIGSSSVATTAAISLAGSALDGTYSVSDFVAEANPEAQRFTARYVERFKAQPDIYSSWAYDAVHLLARSIGASGSTTPESIRKALLAIRNHKGVEGTYRYDANGDGLHGYSVVRNDHGRIVFIKHVSFR